MLSASTRALQGSLLDPWLREGRPHLTGATAERSDLGAGAWIDVARGWMGGTDALYRHLEASASWHADRRRMYERVVDVPRLLAFYDEKQPLPDDALDVARDALDACYRSELRESFATVGLCHYRDGRDSVAWHGDTLGRGAHEDTVVAILSLGAARRLLLRPRGGRASVRLTLESGDLLVMGGSCQRTWEHAVPKTARPVGGRISVQFRPIGVR